MMLDKALEGIASPLAKRWADQAIGSSLVFWTVGALLYLLAHQPVGKRCGPGGEGPVWCVAVRNGTPGTVIAVVGTLAVVVSTSLAVSAATPGLIRVLAGVGWRRVGFLERPVNWLITRQEGRRHLLATGWKPERDERARAEGRQPVDDWPRLRRYPFGPRSELAPTRLGNVFAALDQRVTRRFGLRLDVCWQPLLAVLPAEAHARLAEGSRVVVLRGQLPIWSVAALGWLAFIPGWLGRVGWVVACLCLGLAGFIGLVSAAEAYADQVFATVAAQRVLLYRALGLPVPSTTDTEPAAGRRLSDQLDQGLDEPAPLSWSEP
jgi:hypothetical protein